MDRTRRSGSRLTHHMRRVHCHWHIVVIAQNRFARRIDLRLFASSSFFERQVIADPIMAIFGTLTIFFTLQLAKKQNAVGIIMLALSLAAAVMGKLFGAMYYAVPFFALLLIPIHKKIDRIKLSGYYIASGFLSAILIALFIFALGNKIGVNDQQMASGQVGFLSCPPLICKGDLRLEIEYLASALRSLLELVPPYFGWLVVIVACLALPSATSAHARRFVFSHYVLWRCLSPSSPSPKIFRRAT